MILSPEEIRERNRIACRKWRAEHLEQERERGRRRYQEDKEYEAARSKRWLDEHPERVRELTREAYHRNKNKDIPSNRKENKLYSAAKKRASSRVLEFNIELSDIIIPELCPVLGIPLIIKTVVTGGAATDNSPSIDRIDSTKGYIKGNICVISRRANHIKSFGTAEEHRKIADYIDSFR